MESSKKDISIKLQALQKILNEFIIFFKQNKDYKEMVYEFWNAKDILGHITFWHESFARNISALGNSKEPNILKGKLSEINEMSVSSTSDFTIQELINKLTRAEQIIEQHIYDEKISIIPYKKGARGYTRVEHLDIVSNHIKKHLAHLYKHYT